MVTESISMAVNGTSIGPNWLILGVWESFWVPFNARPTMTFAKKWFCNSDEVKKVRVKVDKGQEVRPNLLDPIGNHLRTEMIYSRFYHAKAILKYFPNRTWRWWLDCLTKSILIQTLFHGESLLNRLSPIKSITVIDKKDSSFFILL